MHNDNSRVLILFLLLILCSGNDSFSQINITRTFDVDVLENDSLLTNAWAGGLYNPQLYHLDIDFDSDKDLVVFDYQGNSVLCFENQLEQFGINTYHFNHDFSDQFPAISNWMHIRDFNCDGAADLLTYDPIHGSVLQYTGLQNTNDLISFSIHDSLLFSSNGTVTSPLSFGAFDRPAFEDVDKDGDLDLIFFNDSDQVDYHANQSIELYGHCDSFLLEFVTDCWGKFNEDQTSFTFNLDTQCDSIGFAPELVHTGSSRMLFLDYENDSDSDLIGGYGSSNNLAFLINGGDSNEAFISSSEDTFPINNIPVDLPSFPAAYFLDTDGDNFNELIVSSSFGGKAEANIWLYKNINNDNHWPIWEKVKDNFLQDQMIDLGAYSNPTIVDYDSDGLPDLVIGNRGIAYGSNANQYTSYLSLYKNTGSADLPAFELIEKDWIGLSDLNFSHLKVSFGDLDNDGDEDLILGDFTGKLFYLENIAAPGASLNFDVNNVSDLFLDVGFLATPHLTDVDEDGDLDILAGEAQGRIFFYKNEGNPESFSFSLEDDFYGQIDVRPDNSSLGYSIPYLYKPDSGQPSILLVGTLDGKTVAFNGVDDSLPAFEELDLELQHVKTGANASPAILPKGDDGGFIIMGNIRGGLQLYEFNESLFLNEEIVLNHVTSFQQLKVFPNPFLGEKINLEFPLFSSSQKGTIYIINSLGQVLLKKTLNLNSSTKDYTIDIPNINLHSGLCKIFWISDNGRYIYHSLLYH